MAWFKPLDGDRPAVRASRIYLLCGGAITAAFSCALVGYAAIHGGAPPERDHVLMQPWAAAEVVGSLSLVTALVGLGGASSASRLALLSYILLVLIASTLLLYVGVLSFLAASASSDVTQELARYLGSARRLNATGGICIATTLLMLLSAAAAGRVAGWKWTMSKMPSLLNVVNLVLASFMVSLATYAEVRQSTNNTRLAVVAGAFGVSSAAWGALAIYARWPIAFRAHGASAAFCGFLSALTAAACIAAGNVHSRLPRRVAGDYDAVVNVERAKSDRLLLVGAYAVISSASLFAEAAAVAREVLRPPSEAPPPVDLPVFRVEYDRFVRDVEDEDTKHQP